MARRPRNTDPDVSLVKRFTQLLSETIPPVHSAGFPFITAGISLGLIGRHRPWLRRAGLAIALGCAGFFRHPHRVPPQQSNIVVAPADGVVCLIDQASPPPELDVEDTSWVRVSIFMSVFDTHVQRFPIAGDVVKVRYQPGKFHSAELLKASVENERNSVYIHTTTGHDVIAVQVAGLIARRIMCFINPGDSLNTGDTYGLIRFGSRLDVYLPADTQPLVQIGQRMVAGETPIALLS